MKNVYITIGVIMRDQSHYVQEWTGFYALQGVDRIVIALHKCSDDTLDKINEARERISNAGLRCEIITHIIKGDRQTAVQMGAYQHIFDTYKEFTEWMLFVDSDEYVFTNKEEISDFLTGFSSSVSQVVISEKNFGHGGHICREELQFPSFNSFLYRTADTKNGVKTFFRVKNVERLLSPHVQICKGGVVNADNHPVVVRNRSRLDAELNSFSTAQYNHYYTRTMEDWIRRSRFGSCNGDAAFRNNKFHGMPFYDIATFNERGASEVYEDKILRFSKPLRKLYGMPVHDITPENTLIATLQVKGSTGVEKAKRTIMKSAERFNIPVSLIEPELGEKWTMSQLRLEWQVDWLKSLPDSIQYVALLDGRDVIFLDDRNRLFEQFNTVYRGGVLFDAQSAAWPLIRYSPYSIECRYGRKVFCSGMCFGEKKEVIELLEWCRNLYRRFKDGMPDGLVEQVVYDYQKRNPVLVWDNNEQPLIECELFLLRCYQMCVEDTRMDIDVGRRLFNTAHFQTDAFTPESRKMVYSCPADEDFRVYGDKLGVGVIYHHPLYRIKERPALGDYEPFNHFCRR